MNEKTPEVKTKDYAGGWITEKEGTEPPAFLKAVIPVIGLSSVAYLVLYMNGEIEHATRGPLVQQLNRTTSTNDAFMFGVAVIVLAFVVVVSLFALRKSH